MPWGIAAVAVSGIASSMSQAEDAEDAAYAQQQAAIAGQSEEQQRFNAIQKLLKPYVDAGQPALKEQQNILGLNGASAQQSSVSAIENSPWLQGLMQQGEAGILQNASATGGLRGGNTQAALGQFRPMLLNAAINDQYGRLGGLVELGQNAAVREGAFGQQSTNNIVALLQQQGAAKAGGLLAEGKGEAGAWNAVGNAFGMYYGAQNPDSAFSQSQKNQSKF